MTRSVIHPKSILGIRQANTKALLEAQSELLLAAKEAAYNLQVCIKRLLGEVNEVDVSVLQAVVARTQAATYEVDEAIAAIRSDRKVVEQKTGFHR